MLRIISERTLDINKELCACFVDWQKTFEHVNWTKLMHVVKETGTDRHKGRISKLYMKQGVKV
jgi:hypothetical protein